MNNFELNTNIIYTTDLRGVSVIDNKNQKNVFITYPEAAVWLILCQKYSSNKSLNLLNAVLFDMEGGSLKFINNCINNWKTAGLIK